MTDKQQILETEQALAGLVKLLKAQRFYPEGHPSLQTAIQECMAGFSPMLANQDNAVIQVNQRGFTLGDKKVGESNLALPDLALMLAERRVNQIIFLPGLPAEEIMIFLGGLTTPAEEIYHLGGLPTFLNNNTVTSVWLNETSLDAALQKRQQLAEQREESAQKEEAEDKNESETEQSEPSEKLDLAQQLRTLIEQLKIEQHDDAYRLNIDRLLEIAPVYFEQSGAPGVLRIIPLLLIQSQEEQRNKNQHKIAADALEKLLTEKTVALILDQFKQTSLSPQQIQRLQKLIVTLGTRIAPYILSLMGKETDANVRKRLSLLLGKMGEPLLDLLREMRHNSKWYVVRNAVALIGDLRLDAGVKIIADLTSHPDQRVRRSLIRSLAMIGGTESVPPLLLLTQDPATALRRPAVKALGATKSLEAVEPLLKIVQSFDPFGKHIDIRSDAVAALGTLGKKEAALPLLALAKRPNLLRLQRLEGFRAEIILALGKLGDKTLDTAFNQWQKSPHAVVRRAADLSLTSVLKKA